MNEGFIMLRRTDDTRELLRDGSAFLLLTLIALRARRTGHLNRDDLQPGEALIGDCAACGLSPRQYRTAKKHLARWHLASFRATSKGTVARMLDTRVYDIRQEPRDNQTTAARPRRDERATTNKNEKNGNKEKKDARVDRKHQHRGPEERCRDFTGQHSSLSRRIALRAM